MILKIVMLSVVALSVAVSTAYVCFCEHRDAVSQARHEERMKQQIDFNAWCKEYEKQFSHFYDLKSQ